ncbi:MAG: CDP-alcohol phosphatidyltransferase family protein [Spirochaetota bacterium]
MEHYAKPANLRKEKLFTLPNIVTSIRVFLLPFFIYYAQKPSSISNSLTLLFITFLAILSDFFDGILARKLQQESMTGKYLDPICDKIVTIGGLSALVKYYEFPLWILAIYICREILGLWLGGFLFLKRGIQATPNIWGKLGVTFVSLTIISYIISPHIGFFSLGLQKMIPLVCAYLMLATVLLGMFVYSKTYWSIVFYPETEKQYMEKRNHISSRAGYKQS